MFFNKSYLLFIIFIFSCFVSFSQVIPVYRDRSYDASYIAILNNAKSKGYRLPSAEQQKTQNELVLALKSAGVWDSLDVLYVFATDADANFAKLNWKNPAAHEGTYVGGVTFQKNGGIKGDGSTGYFNTNFNPATSGVRYTLNNAGRYFWVDNRDTVIFDGVETNSFNSSLNANTANIFINQGSTPLSVAVPFDVDGFHAINRTSSTAVELFTSSTQYSATATSTAIESQTQLLLRSGSSYGASRMRFYAMGSALVSQNTAFLNALNTYITKVGWSGKRASFLDTYTNAAAAYSLRALNSAYTGALIRIRRSTDNREMDIYANQFGDLDTDEIRNFVGMANGFVVTWYDQSGNNRHATQSNTANQPQLVTNGSIYIENRRVAIPHTAGNQQLNLATDLNLGTTYSFFAVAAFSTTGKSLIGGSTSTSYGINVGASSFTHAASTATGTAASTYDLSYSLFSQFRNGTTTVNTARNKTDLLPLTLSSNSNFIFNSIQGERNTSTSFTGSLSEVIIYANDRTSSAVSMRFDINKYFKIYEEVIFDLDYQSVLNEGILVGARLPSIEQRILQNQLVLDLKSAGIWNKLDAIYVFATDGDSLFAAINWKNINIKGIYINDIEHIDNLGIRRFANTGHFSTNYIIGASGLNYTQNDAGRFAYLTSTASTFNTIDGMSINTRNSLSTQNTTAIRINQSITSLNSAVDLTAAGTGLLSINRTSSNDVVLFDKNNTRLDRTATSSSIDLGDIQLILRSSSAYAQTTTIIHMYALGASLVSEQNLLKNAFDNYFNSL